ncbi:483_t:CDS:10 [Acaulospora colombiana]|uniref:483_t:CDS:1 n=1 Tax=Acaulospora colombiana TaxID=27376 RepID=A0ACA9KUG9_9GLOM|nr:483_t:CDS:10 [Acaulospora colombiana]
MVLADLGRRINAALVQINKEPVIDAKVLDALLKEICHALLEADVNVRLVGNLRNNVRTAVNIQDLAAGINKRKAVLDELCRLVEPGVEPYKPRKDPVQIAHEGVDKFKKEFFEIIIVDTSGRHKQESELFEEMKQISSVVNPDNTIFVMDATIGQAAEAQAKAFHEAADIGSIIITKMDGHAKGGGAISAVAATHSPIIFIGTGEHIHDLERFEPRRFVQKMLGMGDISGLMETVKDLKLDQNKNLMKNLEQGIFTIRDMYEQFQNISKMGPLSKMMQMMPGMSEMNFEGSDELGAQRIKRLMTIMDSMSESELDSDEVEELLDQHKVFQGMVKKFGKGFLKGGIGPGMDSSKMSPQQMQQKVAQMQRMLPRGMADEWLGGKWIRRYARSKSNAKYDEANGRSTINCTFYI